VYRLHRAGQSVPALLAHRQPQPLSTGAGARQHPAHQPPARLPANAREPRLAPAIGPAPRHPPARKFARNPKPTTLRYELLRGPFDTAELLLSSLTLALCGLDFQSAISQT
nr:hypothetical protein [Tanacetum cinerariifolium]